MSIYYDCVFTCVPILVAYSPFWINFYLQPGFHCMPCAFIFYGFWTETRTPWLNGSDWLKNMICKKKNSSCFLYLYGRFLIWIMNIITFSLCGNYLSNSQLKHPFLYFCFSLFYKQVALPLAYQPTCLSTEYFFSCCYSLCMPMIESPVCQYISI